MSKIPGVGISPQDNAVNRGAERLAEMAGEFGRACGLKKGKEAVEMLEVALGAAWADVFMFSGPIGANPSPDRLAHVVREAQARTKIIIERQAAQRAGHNPQKK